MHDDYTWIYLPNPSVASGYPSQAKRRNAGWVSLSCKAALCKPCSSWHWSQNGRLVSSQTPTAFEKARCGHDAIEELFSIIHKKPRYVLDADIAQCFDRINHQALLTKLATFPAVRRVVKTWLTAGILEGDTLFPSQEGTPQGGVISPLLANIALHGEDPTIRSHFPKTLRRDGKVIDELKPSKTSITHTLDAYEGKVGFDLPSLPCATVPRRQDAHGKNGRSELIPAWVQDADYPQQRSFPPPS